MKGTEKSVHPVGAAKTAPLFSMRAAHSGNQQPASAGSRNLLLGGGVFMIDVHKSFQQYGIIQQDLMPAERRDC